MAAKPEAISVKQTAEILGLNPITIRRWIERGYIKAYRIGPSTIRIPRSEISRMRAERIEPSAPPSKPAYKLV